MKACALAARAAAIMSASLASGLPNRRLSATESSNSVVSWATMAIMPRTCSGCSVRMSRPLLTQQQAEDGGFAGAALADHANRLASTDSKAQPGMGVAASARITAHRVRKSYDAVTAS
jgi:hypothetical protein